MKEKTFAKTVRTAKIIHLCILLLLMILFLALLITHPTMSKDLFHNRTLLILCSVTWLLMILNLFFLFFDFYKMRFFAEESHALNRAATNETLGHKTGDILIQHFCSIFEKAGGTCE